MQPTSASELPLSHNDQNPHCCQQWLAALSRDAVDTGQCRCPLVWRVIQKPPGIVFALLRHLLQCHKLASWTCWGSRCNGMALYSAWRQPTWQSSMHNQRICRARLLTVPAATLHLNRHQENTFASYQCVSNITGHHGVIVCLYCVPSAAACSGLKT